MSLTGRLIVRVSAFSQRTGNIRIKRNEKKNRERTRMMANGRYCVATHLIVSKGNVPYLVSEPRSVNELKERV